MGQLAERAGEAIRAISTELRRISPAQVPDASLYGGAAGLAVLYAYLSQVNEVEDADEVAASYLGQAIDAVSETTMPAGFGGGLTGIAWATAHLQKHFFEPDEADPNRSVNELLLNFLSQSPWKDDYDLVSGLVGYGVYALEQMPRPSAIQLVERVVDRLDETAERRGAQGLTWLTAPELLTGWQREECPQGYYNLGLAHGIPGIIALLGEVCAAGLAPAKARPLLEGAVAWLLRQKLAADAGSSFANWAGAGIEPHASRLAWCYGDLGIAAALLYAARSVGETAWEHEALDIARRAAERSPKQTGVIDAGLCHGAAGIAHLFHRMYQATGESLLGEAARFWFERTLEMRRPGEGIAGFLAWGPTGEDEKMGWVKDPGILTGAAGIALALLSAALPIEPHWDRMLLVSIPPAASDGSSKSNEATDGGG